AALVTLVTALAVHVAFSPTAAGRPTLFLALGVPYAAFAALAIFRRRRALAADAPGAPSARNALGASNAPGTADPDEAPGAADPDEAPGPLDASDASEDREARNAPRAGGVSLGLRSGDLTLGFMLTLGLGLASALGRRVLAPPGSPTELWLVRIYLQFGEVPREKVAYVATAAAIVVVALLEEITWRGLVQSLLEARFGPRLAWPLGALLFSAAHLPTLWRLEAPGLGPNPLVMLAALGCGGVWGFVAARLGRLGPSLASHALYTYGLTMAFPLWP
ncbi:MAG TPA: CPBP family intramembrane glutamic endopeptidase, partial [Polyangiaceae bacterium]|nr:CPBP family intramembrane glutamic endopeptidase [Polyangiaceae bacterium]